MASTPILKVQLTGEENLAVLSQQISWTPTDKIETTVTMNANDATKTIDFSAVSKVRTLVFYGNGTYKVAITTTGPVVQTYETQDFFIFSPSVAFRATIVSIQVSTTSATDIEIQCRIYGE